MPLAEEYDRKYKALAELEGELESLLRRREIVGKYLSTIEGDAIADRDFDMNLWRGLVDKAVVEIDGGIQVVLHDGSLFERKR